MLISRVLDVKADGSHQLRPSQVLGRVCRPAMPAVCSQSQAKPLSISVPSFLPSKEELSWGWKVEHGSLPVFYACSAWDQTGNISHLIQVRQCREGLALQQRRPPPRTLGKWAQTEHLARNAGPKGKEDEKREEPGLAIPQIQLFGPHTRKKRLLNFSLIPQAPNPHSGVREGW